MPRAKSLAEEIAGTPTTQQKDLAKLREELKQAHRLIEQQAQRIERLSGPAVKLPAARRSKAAKGSYLRVVVPDTHGSHCDHAAIAALLGDLERLQPREIVMLGDHLDCGGFLAEHHTWGYVAETAYTFEDDIRAANQLLDKLQSLKSCPTIHYCEGNHERRIVLWCITQSLKLKSDRQFVLGKLIEMFAPKHVLNIEKRGIHYYKQGEFYDENAIPATITLGQEMLTHGSFCGRHSAKQHVEAFSANVTFGHTHRAQSYISRTATGKTIIGQSHGCLSSLQPFWQHTSPTGWSHGYGIRLVHPNGEFLPLHVPIVDGRSLLVDLADRLR